jgi:hypothetical protein
MDAGFPFATIQYRVRRPPVRAARAGVASHPSPEVMMSKVLGRAGNVAFALLVAAGLSLGASSALAAPRSMDCAYAPWNGQYGVACSTVATCDQTCPPAEGPNACRGGCCTCYI